ncbi:MAG: hypothetical protein HY695_30925 [Deltaproteobacteria bacterium]|nr:hypothetical protein [Deltaproteobacteria bacterium]
MSPEEARPIHQQLASLSQAQGMTSTTSAILKGSLFISHRLFYEARETLVETIRADPDEPTLHFLLGEIYEKTGLKKLALEEYGEAEFLLKKRP